MKTLARIVQRNLCCPNCGWPMHTKMQGERHTSECVTQGCKQIGIKFWTPVSEIKLEQVGIGH